MENSVEPVETSDFQTRKETIVEQIYNQRKLEEIGLAPKIEIKKEASEKNTEETDKTEIQKTSINDESQNFVGNAIFDKNQEVLRKLQELKKSVIKETYGEKYVENPKNEEVQETIDKEKECNEIKYENLEKDSDLEIKEDEKEYVAEEKVQEEKAPEKKQETNEDIIEETKGYEIQSEKEDTKFSPEFEEMYMKMFGTKPSEEQSSKQDGVANEEINDIMKNVDNISIFDRFPETQKTNYKFY